MENVCRTSQASCRGCGRQVTTLIHKCYHARRAHFKNYSIPLKRIITYEDADNILQQLRRRVEYEEDGVTPTKYVSKDNYWNIGACSIKIDSLVIALGCSQILIKTLWSI